MSKLDVVRQRMPRRQVLVLDHRAARGAVVLDDPAPGRVRSVGEFVALLVEDGRMDFCGSLS